MKAPKAKCEECTLRQSTFVPTEVNSSKILVIAEAPGYEETKQGKPLVGLAGHDWTNLIESVGAKREDFIIANSVSCRPTKVIAGRINNRTPTKEEIDCCSERLEFEIDKYDPEVIITMGKTPYVAVGGVVFSSFKMSDVIGTEFNYKKYRVLITYHPAAISHSGGVSTERGKLISGEIKKAFQKARELVTAERQLELPM